MSRLAGKVSIVLAIVAVVIGVVLYYTCSRWEHYFFGSTMFCGEYGFRTIAYVVLFLGGVLFILGFVWLAIPQKDALPPTP